MRGAPTLKRGPIFAAGCDLSPSPELGSDTVLSDVAQPTWSEEKKIIAIVAQYQSDVFSLRRDTWFITLFFK